MTADRTRRTPWGGIADGRFQSSGHFRVAEHDGVFWLVDPAGGRFLSKGVNTVRFDQDRIQNSDRIPYAATCTRKYGDPQAWRPAVARRLSGWGFNTLGSWSDEAVATCGPVLLAATPNLDLGMSFAWTGDQSRGEPAFPDVFDPRFESHVGVRAHDRCGSGPGARHIIGWFIDNELRWGPDWRGNDELLTLFLNLGARAPGRAAVLTWLRRRHPVFAELNSIWRAPAQSWDAFQALERIEPPFRRKPAYERDAADEDAANRAAPARAAYMAACDDFAAVVAERYFALTTAAIRAAAPHHLVLGCRFAYVPSPAVIEAAGRHNDVISFNCYDPDADAKLDTYAAAGKPCIIGEFSFRSADSGLPNDRGAAPVVATQAERAACFRRYVAAALRNRTLVGYHWFEHADQPAEGRFDGENSNYGTVTIDDRPYEELTRAMARINAEAEDRHAAGGAAARPTTPLSAPHPTA